MLSNLAVLAISTTLQYALAASFPQEEQHHRNYSLTASKPIDAVSESLHAFLSATTTGDVRSVAPLISTASDVATIAELTELPGYYFFAQYLDDACTSVLSIAANRLSYCGTELAGSYMYTATDSMISLTKYSDSACQIVRVPKVMSFLMNDCRSRQRVFVSATAVPSMSLTMCSLLLRRLHISSN